MTNGTDRELGAHNVRITAVEGDIAEIKGDVKALLAAHYRAEGRRNLIAVVVSATVSSAVALVAAVLGR